jgi:hypothetical protein
VAFFKEEEEEEEEEISPRGEFATEDLRHMYFSNSAEFKICKGTTWIKYTLERLCVNFLITLFVNGTWSPRA